MITGSPLSRRAGAGAQGQSAPASCAATAYLLDAHSAEIVRRAFADLGLNDVEVVDGGIAAAIEQLPLHGMPHLLLVDISGIEDPLPQINRLTEICAPDTEVIAVGEQNDIVLYRDLRAVGVAEYFYKPLVETVLGRTLSDIGHGATVQRSPRGGSLIFALGVRGGVGVTTIITNLAWHFAEARQRRVLLLDLDLYSGDAALQLGAEPNHALREALREPKRVDGLFLARGAMPVSNCLGLLAALVPLEDRPAPGDGAIPQLLHQLLPHFRYVLVDLPRDTALAHPDLLQLPSTILLVSDGSVAATREVARWREFLGPSTPKRAVLHVLNRKGDDGTLSEKEVAQLVPAPDIAIEWSREIKNASRFGTKAVYGCGAMQHGMTALSMWLAGARAEDDRSFWKRIFG